MYAIYHGPNGLREIANRVHRSTLVLAEALRRLGHTVNQGPFFDTIKVRLGRRLGGGGGGGGGGLSKHAVKIYGEGNSF